MSSAEPTSHTLGFSIAIDGSTNLPTRSIIIDDPDIGYHTFEISAIKKVDAGTDITVNVDAETSTEYQVEILDRELNTVAAGSPTSGDSTQTFSTGSFDTGSFVVAVMVDGEPEAVFPLVVRAYHVTVTDAPMGIQTCGSLTVEAELTSVTGDPINRVELAVMSESDSSGGSIKMENVSGTTYRGILENLNEDEYVHGVVVIGDESINFDLEGIINLDGNEAIGFSDVHDLTVELAASEKLREKWVVAREGRLQHSTAALDNEYAYVGGLDDSFESRWRNSGGQNWEFSRAGSLSDSSPVLHDGTVFVGSGLGTFYALDATSGSKEWEYDIDSAITSTPAIMGDRVYYGANDGEVTALDVASGTQQWTTTVGGGVYSTVETGDGTIFVTTNDGDIVAIDDSGNEQWRKSTGVELGASSPTYHDGTVYVAADQVYALDPADGTEAWSFSGFGGTEGSSPVIKDGVVYVGSGDGNLYALNDSDGGTELWSSGTGDAIAATPTIVGDRVVVASLDGAVYVFDRTTGSELWSRSIGEAMRSSPVESEDEVYVGTEQENVYALEHVPQFHPDATPVVVIDSFEHQAVTANGWSTSGSNDWTYTGNFVGCGEVSLELADDNAETIVSAQGEGLPAYPKQGDAVKYELETTLTPGNGTGLHRFIFGAGIDQYQIDFDIANDDVRLAYDDSGSVSVIDSATDVGLAAETHYEVLLEWDDGSTFGGNEGDMTVAVRDLEARSQVVEISGNDTSRTEGGIGISHQVNSTGDRINTDYLRIMNR